jgi:hypothetical protein
VIKELSLDNTNARAFSSLPKVVSVPPSVLNMMHEPTESHKYHPKSYSHVMIQFTLIILVFGQKMTNERHQRHSFTVSKQQTSWGGAICAVARKETSC